MYEFLVSNLPVLGLMLGCLCALIPGVPGSALACFGILAASSLGGIAGLDPNARLLIIGLAMVGSVGQFLAPLVGHQAVGGSAGSGTGAAMGAAIGSMVLVPGFYWVLALVGAIIGGFIGARGGVQVSLKGAMGVAVGAVAAVLIDLLAVLGIGAVLAVWDTISLLS